MCQTLWNDYGVRLFVEVGPGETLSDLIADTLPEPACIQTCLPSAEDLTYKTASGSALRSRPSEG